jgi:gamma-glutamyltranspeptidase/glutathione hydrolase
MVLLLLGVLCAQDVGWTAQGERGAAAGGGAPAVAAALDCLKADGNAADAAATMLLALSVTDGDQFCFGGEVPILVHDARSGKVEVIAGCGHAPALATLDRFQGAEIPSTGLRSTLVPAALDAVLVLLERHGTRSFADCAAPAIALLEGAGPLPAVIARSRTDFARTLRRLVDAERASGGDRARKLRAVADYFYRGPIAKEIDAFMREHDGLLRAEDLAAHATKIEAPLSVEYRGHEILKCGPWTQGPWLLQALQLLEPHDLKALGPRSPDAVHLMVEAAKLAMADRDAHYGDGVDLGPLLAKPYADLRRPLIDPAKASLVLRPGDPKAMKPLLEKAPARGNGAKPNDTTTCLVADRHGNVIAATPSGWSGAVAGPTGVVLGSRLQSFNPWPGHPNALAPRRRPRITLTPTLVRKAGKPVLAVSVAGGDAQDQVALQMIVNAIDHGLAPDVSVTAPRWQTHHYVGSFGQSEPLLGSLFLQADFGREALEALRSRGHEVSAARPPVWWPCVISIDPATGRKHAAGDPAARRHAAAY